MKLITKRGLIRDAINLFIKLYGDGSHEYDRRGIAVGAELKKLDPDTVSAETVEEIIGNPSWTMCLCAECGQTTDEVVSYGNEKDDEVQSARLCFRCILQGASIIIENKVKEGK